MIEIVLDNGVNCLGAAPAYGNSLSKTLVGEVIKSRRKVPVLASNVWHDIACQGVVGAR
jgi:aryl-alcohol dehydrogenase-like predicted oxidoreductase